MNDEPGHEGETEDHGFWPKGKKGLGAGNKPSPDSDFFSMEVPDELRMYAPERARIEPPKELPPALDRERPAREPIVARTVWIGAAVVFAILVLGIGGWLVTAAQSRVTVPSVTGMELGAARSQLTQAGLRTRVVERRFSSSPEGQVIEQRPGAGVEARRGDTVGLVVSAGTEEVTVPDVVGQLLPAARQALESRGLVVAVETVVSDAASDTVIAMLPAPGVVARSGDVVRLQVASPSPATNVQPYTFTGISVMIDPAPVPEGERDVTAEVGRRLQALLQASGAQVTLLRSSTSTGTTEPERINAALATTPTVSIGLSALPTGQSGRRVVIASAVSLDASSPASVLAQAINTQLSGAAPPSFVETTADDPVLAAAVAPWARVFLGSFADAADRSAFNDPTWADKMARGIYTALGEIYGRRGRP